MAGPLVADTGGILRATAKRPNGRPMWPDFERALRSASRVIVPAVVLVEVDYFLRENRRAMHVLLGEIFDPRTTYQFQATLEEDIARAMELDEKFADLKLGLVDSVIAALAERLRIYRILTIDHEDFVPLRVGQRFTQGLEIVP